MLRDEGQRAERCSRDAGPKGIALEGAIAPTSAQHRQSASTTATRWRWIAASVTAGVLVVVALGSDASASRLLFVRSHSAVAIVVSPNVQTLQTRVVARIDPKTHAPTPILALGTAKFRISVTNETSVALTGVRVTDPLSPGCSRMIETLAPGTSVAYRCSEARVGRNYVNLVSVSGWRPKNRRVLAGAQDAATATAAAKIKVKPKTKTKVKHHAFVVLPFTG